MTHYVISNFYVFRKSVKLTRLIASHWCRRNEADAKVTKNLRGTYTIEHFTLKAGVVLSNIKLITLRCKKLNPIHLVKQENDLQHTIITF